VKTSSCVVPRETQITVLRQVAPVQTITATATTVSQLQIYFALNVLDNAASFANVWDQYRLDAVRVTVKPQNNAVQLVTNSTTALTQLYAVIDYDNVTALGTVAAAREYANCIVLEPGESFVRTFQPRLAVNVYGGAFGSFGNSPPMWLDSASPGVQHYGMKFLVPGVTVGQTLLQSWDVVVEYYVSFANVF